MGSYFDWALITSLLLTVLSGFATEVLHYLRLEPHRHLVYFVHLVFAFTVIVYVPYSKLAHLGYRTAALIFAERYGRDVKRPQKRQDEKAGAEQEDKVPVEAGVG